ncbi:hypothetical protein [Aquamicrobium soli]|jgi:hypothetical protein|uniref:Uncharacterized protein n=1 Tax=Aquamicrobium soli TaxID=1811518 RepID=A0ABV7K8N3_9HYPH
MKGLFISSKGIAYPEELEILSSVFNHFCQDHQIKPESTEAAELARVIISLFEAGLCEEAAIREVLDSMKNGTLKRPADSLADHR